MQTVRWGILSTAKIARTQVIPAMQLAPNCHVEAIASRNLGVAQQVAEDLGIPRALGGYEELLADPDIDAVYIPLPNHLHVDWSIQAVEAGKHVLCEKPVGLDAADARRLLEAAGARPELKVMEAFMYRFHPQWVEADRIVQSGGIGEVRAIQSFFSYHNADGGNIRNLVSAGGGGLMDIGCYGISLARFLFRAEPERVFGMLDMDPDFGTDRLAHAILDFGDRRSATLTCSTQLAGWQRVHILGTDGGVEILIPFNAPPNAPCLVRHQKGRKMDMVEEIATAPTDQYTVQAELFARAVIEDTPVPTPLTDAVANMRAIDAVRASAVAGCWIEC